MIRKVLIANRGEIAVRVCHTLREMGVDTVAVFTGPDKDAVHVKTAGEARSISSYLDAEEIVRTLVGSICLILAVPVTTALAASLYSERPPKPEAEAGSHVHHH